MSRCDNNDFFSENRRGCGCCSDPCNSRSCVGPAGPKGATGPSGARGATGAAGAAILDSYPTYADLIAAHPTGTAGDAYLAGGVLYVWDAATNSWKNMGSLIGPAGADGTNGTDGADGIIGEIDGVVELIADLPADAEQGTIYYVEEDENLYIWDDDLGWRIISVAQGPRGPEGPTGPEGPRGADGILGPIKGVVSTATELPETGIVQGDLYYVEDEEQLYVWDLEEGWVPLGMIQGPRGATGPAGASYMMIPFASTEAPKTYAVSGNPSVVSLLGFGYGDRRGESTLDAAEYYLNVEPSNHSFTLSGNPNRQVAFSVPFDVRLRSIYITVGSWGDYNFPFAVFPYVQLFRAEAGTNNFTAIENAFAIPEQGIGPGQTLANTMRAGFKDGLDIQLPAGTRIAIGAMMQVPGSTATENYWLYFTGGVGLSIS